MINIKKNGIKGFQKGHLDFVPSSSRKTAGIKISLANKGRIVSEITKEKIKIKRAKQIFTEETRKKMSLSRKNKKLGHFHTPESKEKLRQVMLGKPGRNKGGYKLSMEFRKKQSELHRGKNAPGWKGGITPLNLKIRGSLEYRLWREAVFKRDNYACIWCGDSKGGNLEADHIKRFSDFPELRFAIDNGRTLCEDCHKKTDTWGNYKIRSIGSYA